MKGCHGGAFLARLLASCAAVLPVTAGCGDDDASTVRSYRVAKESPPGSTVGLASAEPPTATLAWELPHGWQQELSTSPGSMRYATLWVGQGNERLETSIIALGGDAGGPEANVQRWRGQIGLAPATAKELGQQMKKLVARGGAEGWLVDLVGAAPEGSSGPPLGLLGAIFPARDQTWFLKATGPQPLTDRHRDAFIALCQSVRLDGGSGG